MANNHISILQSVRTIKAQHNPNKPEKPYGHNIADVRLQSVDGSGELKDEYTYIDPLANNVVYWREVIQVWKENRPCHLSIEFPKGIRYKNKKTGLINADVNHAKPIVLDIIDPATGLSKKQKKDPKDDLFDF